MKRMLLPLLMLLSVSLMAQKFDRLEYEITGFRAQQVRYAVNFDTQQIAVWLSTTRATNQWEHKDSTQLGKKEMKLLRDWLGGIYYEQFPETTAAGKDGAWYHLTLTRKQEVVLQSKAWSGYLNEEHAQLEQTLVVFFQRRFDDPAIKAYLGKAAKKYQ